MKNAKSLGAYAPERLLEDSEGETDEGRRSGAARQAALLLSKINGERAPFLRDILRKTFAERIGVNPSLLNQQAAAQARRERHARERRERGREKN